MITTTQVSNDTTRKTLRPIRPALTPSDEKIEKISVALIGAGALGSGAAGTALLLKVAGVLALTGAVFWPLLVFFGICAIAAIIGFSAWSKIQERKSLPPPSYDAAIANSPSPALTGNNPSVHQFSFSQRIHNSKEFMIRPRNPSANSLINGVWYVGWRLQPTDIPPIPEDVNLVNLFVGELDPVNGVGGLQGPFSTSAGLQSFVKNCHAKNIPVMVSIGGHGGDYDNTWNQLTSDNIPQYAKALAQFCSTNGVDGIDFDWEPDTYTQAQGTLVGQLIQQFKALSPNSQASLCTNSATCWETQAGWVFQGAETEDKINPIDRINIMAYYPASEMEPYIEGPGGWEDWVKQFNPPPKITVGMLSDATDLQKFSEFDNQQGLSTGLWYYDPANPSGSNAADATPWDIYHPGASSSASPARLRAKQGIDAAKKKGGASPARLRANRPQYTTYITTWGKDPVAQVQDMINNGAIQPNTMIDVAFASYNWDPNNPNIIPGMQTLSGSELQQVVQLIHGAGAKASLSIGGATADYDYYGSTMYGQTLNTATYINNAIKNYGFDAIDFDVEDPAGSMPADFATQQAAVINTLRSLNPNVSINLTIPGQAWGDDDYQKDLLDLTIGNLDTFTPMEYDLWIAQGNTYVQQIQSDISYYLNTWKVPADKMILGLMPGPNDLSQDLTLAAATQLAQFAVQQGLGGVMTWDADNDGEGVDGKAPYAYTNGIENVLEASPEVRGIGAKGRKKFFKTATPSKPRSGISKVS